MITTLGAQKEMLGWEDEDFDDNHHDEDGHNLNCSTPPQNMKHNDYVFQIILFYEHQTDKITCGNTFIKVSSLATKPVNTKPPAFTWCVLSFSLFPQHRTPIEGKYTFWQTHWLP